MKILDLSLAALKITKNVGKASALGCVGLIGTSIVAGMCPVLGVPLMVIVGISTVLGIPAAVAEGLEDK